MTLAGLPAIGLPSRPGSAVVPKSREGYLRHERGRIMSTAEQRLKDLGLAPPPPQTPVADHVRAVRTGTLVFLAGHLPVEHDKIVYQGKLGRDMDVETGYRAARLVMLNCLASLKEAIGDLDRVRRGGELLGVGEKRPGFTRRPQG